MRPALIAPASFSFPNHSFRISFSLVSTICASPFERIFGGPLVLFHWHMRMLNTLASGQKNQVLGPLI